MTLSIGPNDVVEKTLALEIFKPGNSGDVSAAYPFTSSKGVDASKAPIVGLFVTRDILKVNPPERLFSQYTSFQNHFGEEHKPYAGDP